MNATTIRPGDRVRHIDFRKAATCVAPSNGSAVWCKFEGDSSSVLLHTFNLRLAPRMSLPARTLLAAWHASDRTLHKLSDHVCGLDRIRRYGVTATDGLAVDLTLTTEVQL
jgi:hypothetical protein